MERYVIAISKNKTVVVAELNTDERTMTMLDTTTFLDVCERISRPIFVLLIACFLSVASLRLLVFVALEPGPSVRPSLHYRPSLLSERLIETLPALRISYPVPAGWFNITTGICRTAVTVLATIGSQACGGQQHSTTDGVRFLREYLLTDDDRLISLDWAQTDRPADDRHQRKTYRTSSTGQHLGWIVILMPGPGWICQSHRHFRLICKRLADQGHRAVVWNRRQSSVPAAVLATAEEPSSRRTSNQPSDWRYSSTSHLRQVIQYISSQHPESPLALVGFSHSASLLISYLGEYGSSSLVHSAIAVSPLWQAPSTGLEWLVTAKGLFQKDAVIDPVGDSDDIAVPLLVIHYDDDPFVAANTLPHDLFALYPQFFLVTCPFGGHCGQLQTTRLVDDIVADFIREVLPFTSWPSPSSLVAGPAEQPNGKRATDPRRIRIASLTRSSRKSRKHHFKNGRPSSNSC